jgi:hypothetical protein
MAFAVPKTGSGELREWSSPAVRQDVPNLTAQLRKMIFNHLNPHREQAVRERALREEAWKQELYSMRSIVTAANARTAALEAEIAQLRKR